MIYLLACHKLAVVEAQTVVEQQLYVAHNEVARVLVDGMVQLLRNHAEHAAENLNLSCREVQCLIACVGEKLIARHILAKRSACKEIGVKHQCSPLGILHARRRLHVYRLPRSKCRHRHLVEVVFCASVGNLAALVLLQEEGIHAIVYDGFFHLTLAVEADYAHKWVQCLKAVGIIELLHAVEIYHFNHNRSFFANIDINGEFLRLVVSFPLG